MHQSLWSDYQWGKKSISFVYSFCRMYGYWMRTLSLDSCVLITNSVLNYMMSQLTELNQLHLINCESITTINMIGHWAGEGGEDPDHHTDKVSKPKANGELQPIPREVFCNLKSLSLVHTPLQVSDIKSILTCCGDLLEVLRVEHVSFRISELFRPRRTSANDPSCYIELPSLHTLTLGGYNRKFMAADVETLLKVCSNIETLVIHQTEFSNGNITPLLKSLVRFKKLTKLHVTGATMRYMLCTNSFFQYLPTNLTELTIECQKLEINKDCLAKFLRQCSSLECLKLHSQNHAPYQRTPFLDYPGILTYVLLNAPATFKGLSITKDPFHRSALTTMLDYPTLLTLRFKNTHDN